jgi:hypothetical protein
MATTCLNTTVVNISGEARYFDFLPPYGLTLAADEEFSAPGDIIEWLRRRPRPASIEALQLSLNNCLENELIAIKSSPSLFVWDPTPGETKEVAIAGEDGTLTLEDPCYIS